MTFFETTILVLLLAIIFIGILVLKKLYSVHSTIWYFKKYNHTLVSSYVGYLRGSINAILSGHFHTNGNPFKVRNQFLASIEERCRKAILPSLDGTNDHLEKSNNSIEVLLSNLQAQIENGTKMNAGNSKDLMKILLMMEENFDKGLEDIKKEKYLEFLETSKKTIQEKIDTLENGSEDE